MGDVEARYATMLNQRKRAELQRFIDAEMENPSSLHDLEPSTTPKVPEQAASSSTTKTAKQQPLGVVGDVAAQGWKHIINGIYDAVKPTKPRESIWERSSGVASGMGEAILGGLTIAAALPLGVGSAAQLSLETFTPGLENATMLWGDAAGIYNTMMAVSMLLDPKFREAIKNNPQAVLEALQKPVTFGEFINNMTAFAAAPLAVKAGRAATRRVLPDIGGAVAKGVAEIAREARGTTQPLITGQRALPPRRFVMEEVTPTPYEMTPVAIATRLQILTEAARAAAGVEERGTASIKRDFSKMAPTFTPPKAAEPAQPLASAAEKAIAQTNYLSDLRTQMDVATQRVAEILKNEIVPPEPLVERPYRGVVKPETEGLPLKPDVERVKATQSGESPAAQGKGVWIDEAGRIDPTFLANFAIGAVLGGSQGDTAEERLTLALGGAFGFAFGGKHVARIAKDIVKAIKRDAPLLLDDTLPTVPGFRVPKQPTQILKEPVSRDLTTRNIINFAEGEEISLKTLRRARHVELQAAQQVRDIARRVAKNDPNVPPGTLERAVVMSAAISDGIRRTALGKQYNPTRGMEARVQQQRRSIDNLIETGVMDERGFAELIRILPRNAQVSTAARIYHAFPEMIEQAYYGSILTGKALVKNAVGTGLLLPVDIASRSIGSMVGGLVSKNVHPMEGPAGFVALFEGLMDQKRMIRSWERLGQQAEKLGTTHLESHARGIQSFADIVDETGFTNIAKAIEWISTVVDTGPNLMARTDGASKAVAGRVQAHWEGVAQAYVDGFRDQAAWNRARRYANDPSTLTADARNRITEYANHITFTKNLEGTMTGALQRGPSDPWLHMMTRLFAATFTRTPLRLMEVGTEYTPILNFLTKQYWVETRGGMSGGVNLEFNASRAAHAQARLAVGTATIGGMIWLAQQGIVTGSRPADADQARAMEQAGRPPASIWDPLAQKYRSIDGLGPITTIMTTSADLANAIVRAPDAQWEHLIAAGAAAITNAVDSSDFFKSYSDILDVVYNGRSDSQWEMLFELVRKRLAGFAPAAVREVSTYVQGERPRIEAQPTAQGKEVGSGSIVDLATREWGLLIDTWKRDIGIHEGLKKDRNIFTGEVISADAWPFNPHMAKAGATEPWMNEIIRFNGAGLKRIPQWIGQPEAINLGTEVRELKPATKMTLEQLDRLEVLMTQVVKDSHGHYKDSLKYLIERDPVYKKMPDVTKLDMIQAHHLGFYYLGLGQLFSEDKNLAQLYERNALEAAYQRLPATGRRPAFR